MKTYFLIAVNKKKSSSSFVERCLVPLPDQMTEDGKPINCNLKVRISVSAKTQLQRYSQYTYFMTNNLEAYSAGAMYTAGEIRTATPLAGDSEFQEATETDLWEFELFKTKANDKSPIGAEPYFLSQISHVSETTQEKRERTESAVDKNKLKYRLEHENAFKTPDIENDRFYVEDKFWRKLVRNILWKEVILITGPAGCGKTTIAKIAAERLNMAFRYFNMGTMSDPERTLLGTLILDENAKSKYQLSEFARMIQEPGIILLDEFNRAPALAVNALMSCFDDTRKLCIPQSLAQEENEIKIHPDCVFVLTANISGENGSFDGTFDMDGAMKDRPVRIFLDFPNIENEAKVLTKEYAIDGKDAKKIAKTIHDIRDLYKNGVISSIPSMRASKYAAKMVSAGWSVIEALEDTLIEKFDTVEERQLVKQEIQKL